MSNLSDAALCFSAVCKRLAIIAACWIISNHKFYYTLQTSVRLQTTSYVIIINEADDDGDDLEKPFQQFILT